MAINPTISTYGSGRNMDHTFYSRQSGTVPGERPRHPAKANVFRESVRIVVVKINFAGAHFRKRLMRNPYVSFLQAFGILLVAAGHAFPTDGHDGLLYRWIYSFHMPLWVFLSGYLLRYTAPAAAP